MAKFLEMYAKEQRVEQINKDVELFLTLHLSKKRLDLTMIPDGMRIQDFIKKSFDQLDSDTIHYILHLLDQDEQDKMLDILLSHPNPELVRGILTKLPQPQDVYVRKCTKQLTEAIAPLLSDLIFVTMLPIDPIKFIIKLIDLDVIPEVIHTLVGQAILVRRQRLPSWKIGYVDKDFENKLLVKILLKFDLQGSEHWIHKLIQNKPMYNTLLLNIRQHERQGKRFIPLASLDNKRENNKMADLINNVGWKNFLFALVECLQQP